MLRQWLVQCKHSLSKRERDHINSHISPFVLGDYIPTNTYHLVAPLAVAQTLSPFHLGVSLSNNSLLHVGSSASSNRLQTPILLLMEFSPQFKIASNIFDSLSNVTLLVHLAHPPTYARAANLFQTQQIVEQLQETVSNAGFCTAVQRIDEHVVGCPHCGCTGCLCVVLQIADLRGDLVTCTLVPGDGDGDGDDAALENLHRVVDILAAVPLVQHIERRGTHTTLNKYMSYVVQSD
uniref:Uncharacterized protein n=1 Tax=Lygus hesperus TaxID=30085 RepID=A0A146M8M4_LYGHE